LPSPADPERDVVGANRPNYANPLCARFSHVRPHAIRDADWRVRALRRRAFALLSATKSAESASHLAAPEQCVLRTAGTPKSRQRRRIEMSIETEPTAGESIASEAIAPARRKSAAAKPKGAPAPKARKAAGRPLRSSRAKPEGDQLNCRYCGSDDLAPSFRKRRDARCRACFKQRYGSAARNQKAVRTRKVKAAK
jgi:hypothetical protein